MEKFDNAKSLLGRVWSKNLHNRRQTCYIYQSSNCVFPLTLQISSCMFSLKTYVKSYANFLSPPKDIFSHYFLERGRVRNINLLFSCTCPVQGLNPQAEYVPWLGIEPQTFQSTGGHFNQLSHTNQGCVLCILTLLSPPMSKRYWSLCPTLYWAPEVSSVAFSHPLNLPPVEFM